MFKWLLLLAGAGLFYLWIKGNKRSKEIQKNPPNPNAGKAPRVTEPEVMVLCQNCKVHLPKSDALQLEDRFYCSLEHLQELDEQGWLGNALWRLSPNYDSRPENMTPNLVVIHHISLPPGQFKTEASSQHIVNFFQNNLDPTLHPYFAEIADQKVSSHFLIARSGAIIQLVSTQDRAWHAGASHFFGKERCNDFSIGIELEGDGDTPFAEVQYQSLTKLVSALRQVFPQLQFAGHSDIAPERKTDPGKSFDWKKFQKETGIPEAKLPYGLNFR